MYVITWFTPIVFRAVEQFFIKVDAIRAGALKAIDETRWIPVLTYTTEETEESEEEVAEPSESEMFAGSKAAVWMN